MSDSLRSCSEALAFEIVGMFHISALALQCSLFILFIVQRMFPTYRAFVDIYQSYFKPYYELVCVEPVL